MNSSSASRFSLVTAVTMVALCASITAFSGSADGAQQISSRQLKVSNVEPLGYTLRNAKVLADGGTWFTPSYDRGCVLVGRVQYGATGVSHEEALIEAGNGGNAPVGYTPYLVIYISVTAQTVEFQGTGLTMTVRSRFLTNYANDDFFMFITDPYGNVLQQYELGKPAGDSFTFPSLYQNGFIVHPPNGTGGNFFQLAYANNGLRSAAPKPPECIG